MECFVIFVMAWCWLNATESKPQNVRHNTMKKNLTKFILLFSLSFFGQTNDNNVDFTIKNFDGNGKLLKTKIEKLIVEETLNLEFYRKHFYIPYYFPKRFINKAYKDTTIIVWNDSLKEKDFKTNWTYTTVYDKNSRAVEYIYSGCVICSQFPFIVNVYYDDKNRPIKIQRNYGNGYTIIGKKMTKNTSNKISDEECIIKYDLESNVIEIKELKNGKINIQITKS
jgi:hypothetical protein